jgi:exodeoxyribonuclease V alpha subunit
MAQRLVAHFGVDTLDVIDRNPERLLEVEGIGRVRMNLVHHAWIEQRRIREVMLFLQTHGVSTSHAVKIYKQYKERAIALVKENPYRLATDVFGIGFKSADQIAGQLGIAKTSPERAQAGVLYALGALAEEGHVGAPKNDLLARAAEMLEVDAILVEQAVATLAETDRVVVEPYLVGPQGPTHEAFDGGSAVYLTALHAAEVGSAELLGRLASTGADPIAIDTERALAWYETNQGIKLAPHQKEALAHAVQSKVMVITGGPGTGKTTIVNALLSILEKKGLRIALAAPTGRAAKRMSEATGREAKTLHRLLEFTPKGMRFARDQKSPLDADVVVLDEASMVDVPLFHHFLQALAPKVRLVLVGDIDQLPSVGPGRVLGDVIDSGRIDVVRLTEIFRQAKESLIVKNAHRINEGEMPIGGNADSASDFFFIEREEPEQVLATIKQLIRDRIPKRFGFDPIADVQVLTPMNRGTLGAASLNAELQALLNPEGPSLVRGARLFRQGDKVMQLRNNYDLDVYNGDIGIVTRVDEASRSLSVRYDERMVEYEDSDLDELACAYACSIHKSQGSEYPCVVIPVHTQHYVMLRRNLLYTAVTRGRKVVVLVGSRRAVGLAVRNVRSEPRFTQLAARILDS